MILIGRRVAPSTPPVFTDPGATLAATDTDAVLTTRTLTAASLSAIVGAAVLAATKTLATLAPVLGVASLTRISADAAWRYPDMAAWKTGDTYPPADITLTDDGNPVDVSDASAIKFYAKVKRGTGAAIAGDCTTVDGTSGKVRYEWATADLTEGEWQAEVEVTWSDGGVQTFPPDGYLTFTVKADLDT